MTERSLSFDRLRMTRLGFEIKVEFEAGRFFERS
tara:strand:+ start:266 stop:367 length:102 start_codon:yes stop_codon:yes gene_type:complete